jgi:hypothetical protein
MRQSLDPAPEHVRAAFPPEHEALLVDVGHCACSLFKAPLDEAEERKVRARGKKKGWSERKIERAVSSRSRSGGLDQELVRRIGSAASAGLLSVLVFWDNNKAIPTEPPVIVHAEDLYEQRMAIHADRLVLLE